MASLFPNEGAFQLKSSYSTRLDDELAGRGKEFPGDLESFPPHHHHPANPIGSSWPSMAIGSMEGAGGLLGGSTCPNSSPMIGGVMGGTPALARAAGSPSLGSSVNTRWNQLQHPVITSVIIIKTIITILSS